MIRTIRAFFLARLLREKIMLVAFAVLIAATWFSSVSGRIGHFWRIQKSTTLGLADQAGWIARKDLVEAQANAAASRLDPGRTLNAARLFGELQAIANDSGIKQFVAGNVQPDTSGDFAVYTLQFNVQKTDWETLKSFYLTLQSRSPYIGIEQFSLQRVNGNPQLLDASIKVSSVEVTR